MADVGDLRIKIVGDATSFAEALKKAEERLEKFVENSKTSLDSFERKISKIKISSLMKGEDFKSDMLREFGRGIDKIATSLGSITSASDKFSTSIVRGMQKASKETENLIKSLTAIDRIRSGPKEGAFAGISGANLSSFIKKNGVAGYKEAAGDTWGLKGKLPLEQWQQFKKLIEDVNTEGAISEQHMTRFARIADDAYDVVQKELQETINKTRELYQAQKTIIDVEKEASRIKDRTAVLQERFDTTAMKAYRDEQIRIITLQDKLNTAFRNKAIRESTVNIHEFRKAWEQAKSHQARAVELQEMFNKACRDQSVKLAAGNIREFSNAWEKAKLQQSRYEQATKTGFGSKEWFKERALWFVQLRGFWAVYQGFSKVGKDIAELDAAMTDLKAITVSSDKEMRTLSDSIYRVAESSKFSTVELAKTSRSLAQAGFTGDDLGKVLEGVDLLSTAVGGDLATSVDVVTTLLKAWNLDSRYTIDMVNTLAAGVNKTKLEIGDFSTALSYMAQSSRDVGISVEETVAWMGVLKDFGGLKASQIGTAWRRIVSELSKAKPTEEFERLLKSGSQKLEWSEISLQNKSNTLVSSLRKMGEVGLKTVDILGSSQERLGGVLNAMIKRVDAEEKLRAEITDTNYAYEMAKIQMTSFTNTMQQAWNAVVIGTAKLAGEGEALHTFALGVKELSDIYRDLAETASAATTALNKFREARKGNNLIERLGKKIAEENPNLIRAYEDRMGITAQKEEEGWNLYAGAGSGNIPGETGGKPTEGGETGAIAEQERIQKLAQKTLETRLNTVKAQQSIRDTLLEIRKIEDPQSFVTTKHIEISLLKSKKQALEEELGVLREQLVAKKDYLKPDEAETVNEKIRNNIITLNNELLLTNAKLKDIAKTLTVISAIEDIRGLGYTESIKLHHDSIDAAKVELSIQQRLLETGIEIAKKSIEAQGIGVTSAKRKAELDIQSLLEDRKLIGTKISDLIYQKGAGLYKSTDELRAIQDELAKLNSDLNYTNAIIAEQKRLLERDPLDAFVEGIRNVVYESDNMAEQFESAGREIATSIQGNIADSLGMLGDELGGQHQAWRDWAISALKSIRSVINQLIAMWVVQKLVGLAGSSSSYGGEAGYTAAEGFRAGGGIISSAKSIRKFAAGGMTAGPAIAILGDNPSGKELVIPSEKIKKDSASGYVREKGQNDISVINVVNPDLMMSALSSMQGKQIVINHINSDIWKRGNSYTMIRNTR